MVSNAEQDRNRVAMIEKEIDNYARHNALMKEPREYSLWNMLIAHELVIESEQFSNSQARKGDLSAILDGAKYALQYGLRWIFEFTKPNNRFTYPRKIHPKRLRAAYELLKLGYNYQAAVAAFTSFWRGKSTVEFLSEISLQFQTGNEELRYDVLDRIVSENKSDNLKADIYSLLLENRSTLNRIIDSCTYRPGDGITLHISHGDMRTVEDLFMEMYRGTRLLPDNWAFRGIGICTFREFWRVIMTLAFIHSIAFTLISQSRRTQDIRESVLMHYSRDAWINKIKRFSNIDEDDVSKIVQIFTYNNKLPKPDPALQPFMMLDKYSMILPPGLILGCNIERNLMAFLAKNHTDEYNATTGILEDSLLDDIDSALDKMEWLIAKKRRISGDASLPDVDLAILDEVSRCFLIVEAKWVIPPSEYHEKLERAERAYEGIKQIHKLLEAAVRDKVTFINSIFPGYHGTNALCIKGLVLFRGFVGTAENFDLDVPVVEESLFLSKCFDFRRLDEVWNWMYNREFLPQEGKEYVSRKSKIQIGKYSFYWNEYKLK